MAKKLVQPSDSPQILWLKVSHNIGLSSLTWGQDRKPLNFIGLYVMQISSDYMKVHGRYRQKCGTQVHRSSGLKRAEIRPKNQFFEKVPCRQSNTPLRYLVVQKKYQLCANFLRYGQVRTCFWHAVWPVKTQTCSVIILVDDKISLLWTKTLS